MSKADARHSAADAAMRVVLDSDSPITDPQSHLVARCEATLATREAALTPHLTDAEYEALWLSYSWSMDAVASAPATTPEALAAKASIILAEFQENPPSTPEEAVAWSLARDLVALALMGGH